MNENFPRLDAQKIKTCLLDQWTIFQKKDIGIEREQLSTLVKLKKPTHAVVISGLRRVGKSTLLVQLSKQLKTDSYYYINFEDERLSDVLVSHIQQLHEILIELFGERRIFLLDEIQNMTGWERFVRRFMDMGFKFYLTGSNASLLSQELGTKLTGRYIPIELYPFSFAEYLHFKNIQLPHSNAQTTTEISRLRKLFSSYTAQGGIPDALKYPELSVHKTLYDDVLYRDIATRYQIIEVASLKELSYYLMSNISSLISYNKLKDMLKLGSVNTVKSYIDYLQESWLLFVVNTYAYSLKKQQIAPKKIYAIDPGLANSIGFGFSENRGKYLENVVFLKLRATFKDIYYYKTATSREVDFYIPSNKLLIQVCVSLVDTETKKREIQSLTDAMKELRCKNGVILTETEEDQLKIGGYKIDVKPIPTWLLNIHE